MTCLDLLQCYSQRLVQQVWALCSKSSAVFFQVYLKLKKWQLGESLLEIWSLKKRISNFKKQSSVKSTQITLPLLVVLGGSLLLSGCATSPSFQFSAPSSLESNSSLSHPQKIKKQSQSSGDSSNSLLVPTSPRRLQQDTFLLYQSPLWAR